MARPAVGPRRRTPATTPSSSACAASRSARRTPCQPACRLTQPYTIRHAGRQQLDRPGQHKRALPHGLRRNPVRHVEDLDIACDPLHHAPADADEVKEEAVNVECIDLYLRPTFNFKCVWAAKNKSAELAVDAITGELQTQPSATMALVAKLMKPEMLFDIGAETLNLVVPGGAIPLKIVQALAEKRKS